MEAIGQLAGGISHDFNNMLTVILNYCHVLIQQAGPSHPWLGQINEIRNAAERSAALTKQLLVFCRKQFVRSAVVDLNEMVLQNEQMLRRLISERIELRFNLQPNAGSILVDQNEFHQILINLVLNSRDAIVDNGTIEIETLNEIVTPNQFPNIVAGVYNVFRVRDTGHGIASNLLDRIFEPFFTTKEVGKGTGLGLSIVYGIVQQCGGYIHVDSQVGKGTTIAVYFPPATENATVAKKSESTSLQSGSETILLVEDELALRTFCCDFLTSCGYRVLSAENGAKAIDIASKSNERIDLVVSDVVMPAMSAKLMSTILLQHRPGLKILFMSGYNNEDFVDLKRDMPTTRFLQKPFAVSELAQTIREILDEKKSAPK
jgi:two-component system, cell cycle sensor histidine kinase and response regulator CckA